MEGLACRWTECALAGSESDVVELERDVELFATDGGRGCSIAGGFLSRLALLELEGASPDDLAGAALGIGTGYQMPGARGWGGPSGSIPGGLMSTGGSGLLWQSLGCGIISQSLCLGGDLGGTGPLWLGGALGGTGPLCLGGGLGGTAPLAGLRCSGGDFACWVYRLCHRLPRLAGSNGMRSADCAR